MRIRKEFLQTLQHCEFTLKLNIFCSVLRFLVRRVCGFGLPDRNDDRESEYCDYNVLPEDVSPYVANFFFSNLFRPLVQVIIFLMIFDEEQRHNETT